ncbi:hypothetical protein ZIOFF_067855 [Zingiber officinale]|uniref:DUF4218 domain-containing protein n=1 Tax=Zingiber officinale TaxID=94328 RepID=A0A8J5C690_ZINOF|nr:hypothetical protein ZIOFF_067855 [Zingiber officinale]
MKTLKGYVKNRARPEGCIAECYLAEERMMFCSAYIKNASNIGVRSNWNDDLKNGLVEGRPISQGKENILEDDMLQIAHRYVLFNTAEVEPYLQMHIEELKQTDSHFLSNETLLQKQHMETFAEWLSKHVPFNSSGRIQWLAYGPRKHVTSYTGYIINGHRFHTIDVGRSTQDSGVSIEADIVCQSNANDYSHTETIASHDLHGEEQINDGKPHKKKGRGASKLKMVSGQDKCKELERNELGQPIGDNSVKYASFLGCMIKEFVPYTLDGWNEIGEEVKDRMWSCLQLNYKVEDWEKKVIFQKLAKLWRDRKSKLQILIREVNTGRAASRDLNLLKPEFMEQNQ